MDIQTNKTTAIFLILKQTQKIDIYLINCSSFFSLVYSPILLLSLVHCYSTISLYAIVSNKYLILNK